MNTCKGLLLNPLNPNSNNATKNRKNDVTQSKNINPNKMTKTKPKKGINLDTLFEETILSPSMSQSQERESQQNNISLPPVFSASSSLTPQRKTVRTKRKGSQIGKNIHSSVPLQQNNSPTTQRVSKKGRLSQQDPMNKLSERLTQNLSLHQRKSTNDFQITSLSEEPSILNLSASPENQDIDMIGTDQLTINNNLHINDRVNNDEQNINNLLTNVDENGKPHLPQGFNKDVRKRGENIYGSRMNANKYTPDLFPFAEKTFVFQEVPFEFPFKLELIKFDDDINVIKDDYNLFPQIRQYFINLTDIIPPTPEEISDFRASQSDHHTLGSLPNQWIINNNVHTYFSEMENVFCDFTSVKLSEYKNNFNNDMETLDDLPRQTLFCFYLYGISPINKVLRNKQFSVLTEVFLDNRKKQINNHIISMLYYMDRLDLNLHPVFSPNDGSGRILNVETCLKYLYLFNGMAFNVVTQEWINYKFIHNQVSHAISLFELNFAPLTEYQKLIKEMKKLVNYRGFMMDMDGNLCREVPCTDQRHSFHWRKEMDIGSFFDKYVTEQRMPELWAFATKNPSTRSQIITYFKESRSEDNMLIYPRRSAFSFENGVLYADNLTFYSLDKKEDVDTLNNMTKVDDAINQNKKEVTSGFDFDANNTDYFLKKDVMCSAKMFKASDYGQNAYFKDEWITELETNGKKVYEAFSLRQQLNNKLRIGTPEYVEAENKIIEFFDEYMLSTDQWRNILKERAVKEQDPASIKWYKAGHHYSEWKESEEVYDEDDEVYDPLLIKLQKDFYKYSTYDKSYRDNKDYWGYLPASFFNVRTPNVDKLFADQAIPIPAVILFYVFVGRYMYEVGEYDKWQMALFIEGIAGTGKSTVGTIISNMFDKDNIASLGNSARKDFFGSNILGKYIAMGMDIDDNWSIDQATLQSFISGERCMVEKKHHDPLNIERMITHLILFGNKFPNFSCNGNAIPRRFLHILFKIGISTNITGFEFRLLAETPAFILKSMLLYKWALTYFGVENLYKHPFLPHYYKVGMKGIKSQLSPLYRFIMSGIANNNIQLCKFCKPKESVINAHKSLYFGSDILNDDGRDLSDVSMLLPSGKLDRWDVREFLIRGGIKQLLDDGLDEDYEMDVSQNDHQPHDVQVEEFGNLLKTNKQNEEAKKKRAEQIRNKNILLKLVESTARSHYSAPDQQLQFVNYFLTIVKEKVFKINPNKKKRSGAPVYEKIPLKTKQILFYMLFDTFALSVNTFNKEIKKWEAKHDKTVGHKKGNRIGTMIDEGNVDAIELFQKLKLKFVSVTNTGYKFNTNVLMIIGMKMQVTVESDNETALKSVKLSDVLSNHTYQSKITENMCKGISINPE